MFVVLLSTANKDLASEESSLLEIFILTFVCSFIVKYNIDYSLLILVIF